MKNMSLKLVVVIGFSSVVVTLIGCTYWIGKSLKSIDRSTDNHLIVDTIESEGKRIRASIEGKPQPVQPYGSNWLNP
jgi:hypothetical protein